MYKVWGVGIVFALVLMLWGMHLPHVGLYNANNNYLSLASKNFLRFGYTDLSFLPSYHVGAEMPTQADRYLHHPVLFFLIASFSFAIFGDGHWVVHIIPLLFTLGSLYVLYMVIAQVSGRRVAIWSTLFAMLFPMLGFFWKQMFFEQPSLFFTLSTLYFAVRYIKSHRTLFLWAIAAASFLGASTDWYGGYLVFGLGYLLLSLRNKSIAKASLAYLIGAFLGFGTYALALFVTNNVGQIVEGYSARAITGEITGLSYWPIRFIVVTVLRLLVYFSPLLLVALWQTKQDKTKAQGVTSARLLAVFLIIGVINIVVLPAATWGHSYFLYYLVPWAAYLMGLWFERLQKKATVLAGILIVLQCIWSFGITGLKISQVKKHTWKYDLARDVSHVIPRYSTVGVTEFPGDVLENYFLVDTIPLSLEQVKAWAKHTAHSELSFVVITCPGVCTPSDTDLVDNLRYDIGVREFRYGNNVGWLLGGEPTKYKNDSHQGHHIHFHTPNKENPSRWVHLYRRIRDALGSTQL